MQKTHFHNEDVRPSHLMGLHKIPYTRETWHAKMEKNICRACPKDDKQPQHFWILSLVLHCRGQVLTPGLLALSLASSSGTIWECLIPLLPHILPCVMNQCSLYYFVQVCFNYHPWNSACVQPQYLPECHQNVRLYECKNVNPFSWDSLCGSSFDLLIHSGQRPFYLLTAIQPPFLFSYEIGFLSKTGEVLTTEKEITFWFNFWRSFILIRQLRQVE